MTVSDLSTHIALTALSTVSLALTLALIGGWVVAGAETVPKRLRGVHRATGMLFVVLSAQGLNRIRLDGAVRNEDWSITVLRVVAVALGMMVLWMHWRHHRERATLPPMPVQMRQYP